MTIKNLAAAAFAAAALITVPASLGTASTGTAPANSITAEAASERIAQGYDINGLTKDFIVADGLVYYMNHKTTEAALAGRWTNTTAVNMPDSISYKGKTYEITSVRNDAFSRDPSKEDRYYIRSFRAGCHVKTIGDRAFKNCYLKDVFLSSSVETIGSEAFYGTSVKEIVIPHKTTTIGDRAFAKTSLTEIFFDCSASSPYLELKANAFSNNEQLRKITNYRKFKNGNTENEVIGNAFERKTPYIYDEFGDGFMVYGWYRDVLERVIFK